MFAVVGVWYFGSNSNFLQIDSCLDMGGKYNYQLQQCEYMKKP